MSHSSSDKGSHLAAQTDIPVQSGSSRLHRRPLAQLLLGAFLLLVVLALALGLGLGLGLKKHHGSAPSSSSSNSSTTPTLSLDQLVNASQFTLDPSFKVTSAPTTREYNWTVSLVNAAPVGVTKPMIVVNGMSPGPVIEANSQDRIIVHVTNTLENDTTTIHWHGLYQNGTNYYDGSEAITQCGIPPGETMTYNFTMQNWVGTTWWHAHTATQYTDGLVGPIIVHSTNETVPEYEQDIIVQLSDVYNTWSPTLLAAYLADDDVEVASEPVPDAGTINGIGQFSACYAFPDQSCDGQGSYFNFSLAANKTYRLRLINSGSFTPIRFSVDGHPLTVIEADGTAIEPIEVAGVTVQVAQRYSVLLRTSQTQSAYWMRAVMNQTMYAYTNDALNPNQFGILRYDGSNDSTPDMSSQDSDPGPGASLPDLDATALVPADAINAPSTVAHQVPWTFSIQRTNEQNWRAFINSTSWTPLGSQSTLTTSVAANTTFSSTNYDIDQLITTVDDVVAMDFIMNNLDDGDHPFHLHGYKPWILGQGPGLYTGQFLNTTNPLRRDVFLIPAFNWMVIRIVTDNPGYWAFHCHLQWHMAAGGLFQLAVQPSNLAKLTLPDDVQKQCSWSGSS